MAYNYIFYIFFYSGLKKTEPLIVGPGLPPWGGGVERGGGGRGRGGGGGADLVSASAG